MKNCLKPPPSFCLFFSSITLKKNTPLKIRQIKIILGAFFFFGLIETFLPSNKKLLDKSSLSKSELKVFAAFFFLQGEGAPKTCRDPQPPVVSHKVKGLLEGRAKRVRKQIVMKHALFGRLSNGKQIARIWDGAKNLENNGILTTYQLV